LVGIAITSLAVLVAALPAHAADCGTLTRAISLDLAPGPGGGPRFGVPVTVNGTPRTLMLNTAYRESRLSRSLVTQLGLSPRSAGKMLSVRGGVANGYVVTVDLGIGPSMIKDNPMRVDENDGPFDGAFGADLMDRYDIELDFAARKLNYFLTDHCDGKVVSWPNAGATSVPFRGWGTIATRNAAMRRGGLTPTPMMLTIPVSIDGHELQAMVNTSLPTTTLEADDAHALFDLSPDSAGAVPMGTMDGNPAHRVFGYTFKTLAIGGVTISNPRISVMPNLLGTTTSDTLRADTRLGRRTDDRLPPVRLGMDMLRRLHLYIATKEEKL
jgi:hypothetical protein